MIKALKILSWLAATSVILVLLALCIAYSYTGAEHGAMAAIRDVVCKRLVGGQSGQTMASFDFGQAIGKYIVIPAVTYTILLLALYKRSRPLYITTLVLLIFFTLGEFGNGHVPFFKIILISLLFTTPARIYFKKPDPNQKIADSF